MKKWLFFAALTLFFLPGHGQTGTLNGHVKHADQGVELATVRLQNGATVLGTTTDASGFYEITDVPAGSYTLEIRQLGYQTITETVEILAGKTTTWNQVLEDDLLQLDQMVVTGTRNAVPLYNSPVIVNEISDRTFEATQSLSLSEGLNFSPGLRVETNCQNCGFTQLRMNGLEGAYSQILINSRPIFSALAGVYGLDMIPANMVDRIEVVKGGGSVLYGGNAIAGTVNILTKDPVENSFEIGLNQSFIDLDTPDRTLSFNGAIVSDDLSHGISLYGYNRQREPWDANDDGYSEITLLENNTFGFDAFWNPSLRNKIKLNAYSVREFRRGGNGFDLAPHQTDIAEQLDHRILGVGLSFEQYSKDYRHKFSVYGSGQFTERSSYYGAGGRVLAPGDTLTEEDLLAINAYGESEDIALVGGLQYTFEIRKNLVLTAGSEYQYNDVLDEMPGYERLIDQQVGTIGTYAQLEWEPVERLSILAGGRFDHVTIDGVYDLAAESFTNDRTLSVVVPRLSALYTVHKNLKARVSFAQGYRAPQAFDEDLHIETVGGAARFIQLDPNLETERSNSFTASLNYTQRTGDVQTNIVVEGFYTALENPFLLSDQAELPSGVAVISKRNGDGAIVQGINLEANMAFSRTWMLQLGATLQSARFVEEEELWAPEDGVENLPPTTTRNLLRTPDAYGFVTVTYKPVQALQLSYSGVFTGPMDVAHVIDPETEYTIIERTPTFFENNAKIAYTVNLKGDYWLELFGGMQNIFNSFQDDFDRGPDRDVGYIYGPSRPRTVFGGLKIGFN